MFLLFVFSFGRVIDGSFDLGFMASRLLRAWCALSSFTLLRNRLLVMCCFLVVVSVFC